MTEPRLVSLCAALAMALPATAAVTPSGVVFTYPAVLPIGPGDTLIGNDQLLHVGRGAFGELDVDGGSLLRTGSLILGDNNAGARGNAVMNVSGVGTRLQLNSLQNDRLGIGTEGVGVLNLSGGATVNGLLDPGSCTAANACQTFVGLFAGSEGSFNLSGAGTQASFLKTFVVAHGGGRDGFGTPGAATTGRVSVTAGALLQTQGVNLAREAQGSTLLGTEVTQAFATISGAGSLWRVLPRDLDGRGALVSTAQGPNASATLLIEQGGRLRLEGKAGVYNAINLSDGGGRTDLTLTGSGSALEMSGDASVLQIGALGGTASFAQRAGAAVSGVWYTSVGRNGASGELTLDGSATRYRADGMASASANGTSSAAVFDIGRGGSGGVSVHSGARLELVATQALGNGPNLSLGRESASSGRLDIAGVGSVVSLTAQSVVAGGGPGEAFNPLVRVGRDGSGTLNITAGGQLLLDGEAVSTVADPRSTSLYIGGSSLTTNGGTGLALVSGAGSAIALTGSDPYIGIGHGPQSHGQLTVADGASVSSTSMNVGRAGGMGVLALDAGVLNLSGQQTGNNLSGANLSIGTGGTGIATLTNGSVVTISNPGSLGASLSLGGTLVTPRGDGSMTVSGGSRIQVIAAPGLAVANIGRDGTGFLRLRGASSLDVGDGNLYIGRLAGSDGTLIASENSTLGAGWVGVGRNRTPTGSVDGGSATLVLNNSVLTAPEVVIGAAGFLGGNGTINGHVTNYGVFSPGNSPGTFAVNGAFTAGAGGQLILEVEADGLGGFKTDQLVFGNGTALDLSALSVEFRFLGSTDPNAFQASGGFGVDSFFRALDGAGASHGLAHAAFAGASFSARADGYQFSSFSFSADGGAVFSAQAVPEAPVWLLLTAGMLAVALRRRRLAQA